MVMNATKLNPFHPPTPDWILGQAHFFSERYENVIRVLMGDAETALATFIAVRRRELSVRRVAVEGNSIQSLAGGCRGLLRNTADWDHVARGLQLAGLPENSAS